MKRYADTFFFPISLIADELIITILPVVPKDLPISPRFTPYDFLSRCKFGTLQLVNQWLNFTYSRSHAFRYERKNINPAGKNRTHDFRTSRCAGYLLFNIPLFIMVKAPYHTIPDSITHLGIPPREKARSMSPGQQGSRDRDWSDLKAGEPQTKHQQQQHQLRWHVTPFGRSSSLGNCSSTGRNTTPPPPITKAFGEKTA